MKVIDLECFQCGAIIKPDVKTGIGVCEYCGNQVVFDNDSVTDAVMANALQNSSGYDKEQEALPKAPNPEYVSWSDSDLTDHVMDWKDKALEAAMREVTGIADRDIMLSDVFRMTSLQLNGKGIEKVDALNELTNLQSLVLESNGITDISGLTDLKNITFLNLYKNRVSDIGGIAYMPLVRDVRLDYNHVSDLSALANLKYIERLYVYMNRVTDISPLKNLISLKDLRIDFNPIEDISALKDLKYLESLNLMQTKVEDLSPLLGLKRLKEIQK